MLLKYLKAIHFSDSCYYILACEEGDVSFQNEKPSICFGGETLPICGDAFWNNNVGADIFCRKLTASSDTVSLLVQLGQCAAGYSVLQRMYTGI